MTMSFGPIEDAAKYAMWLLRAFGAIVLRPLTSITSLKVSFLRAGHVLRLAGIDCSIVLTSLASCLAPDPRTKSGLKYSNRMFKYARICFLSFLAIGENAAQCSHLPLDQAGQQVAHSQFPNE